MVGIGRKAVETDVAAIATQLNLPLRRLVARPAKTLQLASDERGPVALMRLDVIDHVRRRDDPALQTELTEQMLYQLELAQPSPARGFIEVLPRNRVTANSRHECHPCRNRRPIRDSSGFPE